MYPDVHSTDLLNLITSPVFELSIYFVIRESEPLFLRLYQTIALLEDFQFIILFLMHFRYFYLA